MAVYTKKRFYLTLFMLSILFIVMTIVSLWPWGIDGYGLALWWKLQLPNWVATILVGAGLAASGAVLQTLLKNPLADTSLLGLSSGSQFFGILVLAFLGTIGQSFLGFYLACLIGALFALLLFLSIIFWQKVIYHMAIVILLGVALSSLFSAGMTLIFLFLPPTALKQTIFWQFGGFDNIRWMQNGLLLVTVTSVIAWVGKQHRGFDLFALGDQAAQQMGLSVKHFLVSLVMVLTPMIAAIVAVAGPIGFVGLVSPHIARGLIKTNTMRHVLPLTILIGAILVSSAQWIAVTVATPVVIPVGVITALIGAPFLIGLVFRQLKGH